MKRYASAEWQGSLKEGKGFLTTDSHVLARTPYSFATRFENERGTNPEELIGAAHAGCFSMALSAELAQMKLTPTSIRTEASVTIEKQGEGFKVTAVHLTVRGEVSGADPELFQKAAENAKKNCPISKLLNAEITMDASLEEGTRPQMGPSKTVYF